MKANQIILNIVLPVVVLAGAFQFCGYMVATAPKAPKVEHVDLGLLVQTQKAVRETTEVTVTATGRVKPARIVMMQPQITGIVEYVSPKMVLGGLVDSGEELVRLDNEQYRLQVRQNSAQISQARFAVDVEKGHQTVAKREWEMLGDSAKGSSANKALALRQPHLKRAKANLSSARSGLKQAKLNVERATVVAPFNAFIKVDNVEMGQLAGPQSQLATLVGTDAFWIEANVPVGRLKWMDIPGVRGFSGDKGSHVDVMQRLGDGTTIKRTGSVIRLLSELDQSGVQARIIVEVQDPLLRAPGAQAQVDLPLLLGSFVELDIKGHDIQQAIAVPRVAMREGNQVWVATKEMTLDIRTVGILWRTRSDVLVSTGLEPGDRIIVSAISAPVQGMKLRDSASADAQAKSAGADSSATTVTQ